MRIKMGKYSAVVVVCLVVFFLSVGAAFANKASVRIEAPESAALGSAITITLHISHEGNNFIHYTDWVYLKIDGEEVARWVFSSFDKPESEKFTRTFTHTINKPIEIASEADCNIHGGAGVVKKTVGVQ